MPAMDENVLKKIPPQNVKAEQGVIAAMFVDAEAITIAAETLKGEDFFDRQCGILFDTMVEMRENGKSVDAFSLQERLEKKGVPPEISGLDYMNNWVIALPISPDVKQYVEIVAEKSMLRKMIHVNQEIANTCYAGKESLENILAEAEKQVFQLAQRTNVGEFVPIRQIVNNAMDKIDRASKMNGNVTGVATGFIDLDYRTSGMQPSDLVLIAARPSMGKTAFALNIAQNVAFRQKKCVAIFSLEMSKEQLVNRLFALESNVDAQKLRTGNLADDEWDRLIDGAAGIGRSDLIIDDTPGISVAELRSKCRKFKMDHELCMIIIDYLQLMTGSGKSESRQQEISEISRALKAIARELNVPVLALSQLSRAVEQRPNHRPMLSDLRESGAIEQDADVVMFIYRDDYYNEDTDKKGISEIIVAKQRNGPIGTVELVWMPEYTRFANMDRRRMGNGDID